MKVFRPSSICPLGLRVLVASVFLAGAAFAHNGEPRPGVPVKPPKQPRDLRAVVAPPRWSWIHWWEANRDRFLVAPEQESALQPATRDALDAQREAAAGELLKAIESNAPPALTIESALALGKMRYEAARPTLVVLATKSERGDVRRAALLSLGLLASGTAEKDLIQVNPGRLEDRVTAIVALGLQPRVSDATLLQLRSLVTTEGAKDTLDKVGASSVTTWALRHHAKDDNLEYFRNLLARSISPWVASEALIGLGGTRDHGAQRLLESALFGTAVDEVQAFENLERVKREKARMLGRDAERPIRDESGERRDPDEAGLVEAGAEVLAMGWLQSSAAIALGDLEAPRAGEALLKFLDEDVTRSPYLLAPMGFAIMSLAAYPTEATRDRFIGLVGGQDERGSLKLDVVRDSPLRGYAALALGLYAAPYTTDQGPADRPGFEQAVMALERRLLDERETEEVRNACAVALGLTRRSDVLPILNRASPKPGQRPRRGDAGVWGFVMLGRALAGDKNLTNTISPVLLDREDDVTPSGIMSRRAGVLALGVTRSAGAIPVLTKAWHLNHYVNREVILALRLVGGTNAATTVLDRLRKSKDPEERAYMAQALGELLAHEQPTALSRLTAGSNYTVRNSHLLPLQSLANTFLFDYLIASFGEDW